MTEKKTPEPEGRIVDDDETPEPRNDVPETEAAAVDPAQRYAPTFPDDDAVEDDAEVSTIEAPTTEEGS